MKTLQVFLYVTLLMFSLAGLSGETALTSLEEIAAFGVENNLDYRSDRNSVLSAEENVVSYIKLEESSLQATGSYSSKDDWALNSSMTLPVIDQLSFSGNLNDSLDGNVSLNFFPLAHSSARDLSIINYSTALLEAEHARISSEIGAVSAALDWMKALRNYETENLQAELSRVTYLDDKVRFEMGEITFDDLQESLKSWSEDRVSLSETEKVYRTAETNLYSELGAGKDELTISMLTIESLEASLEDLISSLDPQEGDYMKNNAFQQSVLNRMSSMEVYKNTWAYEPDISASAGFSFNKEGIENFSASFTFGFSLDDIQVGNREISKEEYEIALLKENQSRNVAELEFSQIIDAIESTSLNREIAYIEYEQAGILLSEAELLFKRGDISQLELDQSGLTEQISANALFSAVAEEYEAWNNLKKYL